MSTRDEQYAEKTRADRLKVHELVGQGMTEKDAMIEAFPKKKDRPRTLSTWKKKGLWPIPQEELDGMAHEQPVSVDTHPDVIQPQTGVILTDDQKSQMLEILDWWQANKDHGLQVGSRPEFKRDGGTVVKAIRISREMFDAADQKAKADKARTGGNFSSLVELLLWKYLDEDPRFIEQDQGNLFGEELEEE